MTTTIAITNQKGGVHKTTTAVLIAHHLADRGHKVLLVDLDQHAGATRRLLGPKAPPERGTADLLLADPRPALPEVTVEAHGLSLCPSTPDLEGMDLELQGESDRATRLQAALSACEGRWDFVLLDCPTSLGLLTVNALRAADFVLCPFTPSDLSVAALDLLEPAIAKAQQKNPRLQVLGYLLSGVSGRDKASDDTREELKARGGARVLRSEVRVCARLRRPMETWKRCRGVQDHEVLVRELLRRMRRLREGAPPSTLQAPASTEVIDAH